MVTTGTALLQSSKALDRYLRAAKDAGCPADQILNFLEAGIVLQPRQLAFAAAARMCDRPDGPTKIGYGGARGGGKSHASLAILYDDCRRQPGLKCLFLRKVMKSARESFNDLRNKVLRNVPNDYVGNEGRLEFPNGSKIILGHFANESDIDAYLGLEYDVICIEESTTLSASKQRMIRTCLRTSKPGWRPREYHTTNPGGIGHAVFKETFILPQRRGRETDTRFVPATVDDNPFLNREYTSTLDSLVGWQYKAWRLGDWDIAAGQFFTNWRHATHVVEPFEIPEHWRVWCSMDYGFTHPTVCHLFARDEDSNVYVVDEHKRSGWLPVRHADAIKAMLERNAVALPRLQTFVAGADVFAAGKDAKGRTIAQQYDELGIKLKKADDDRVNGAGEILTRLGDVDPEPGQEPIKPSLFVFDRCAGLIETIPAMIHDPNRPEDVLKVDVDEDGKGGDDPYDCGRYGVMVMRRKPIDDAKPFFVRLG